MSPTRQILVFEPHPAHGRQKPAALLPKNSGVVARVVDTMSDAMRELQGVGYDAVFVRVDGPEELSLVLRIKNAAPEVPICALIPDSDPDLERLARESGADEVLPAAREPERAGALLSRAFATTEDLIRRNRAVIAHSIQLRDRAEELRAKAKTLKAAVFNQARIPVKDLIPLLVEDDPDHAFFFKRSFEKHRLPFPLPVISNGEEAIVYLSGRGQYGDRARYPLPTLLIADLHVPRKDGFELIRWSRSQPDFAKLVIFIMTSSPLRKDVERALTLGADCFYIKPIGLDTLDEITQIMAMRWALIRQARQKA